jgi:DsbC/DsbD-like thiol-disulfide interchange protein
MIAASHKNDCGISRQMVAKTGLCGQIDHMGYGRIAILRALAFAVAMGATPALASSTDWFETQGGRIRLVTAGTPDAQGRIKGVLDIALDPGWKTYWRDPGDAGVPPQLDVSGSTNIAEAKLSFPPRLPLRTGTTAKAARCGW